MLAHKAVHDAHVAAEVIAGELQGNKDLANAAFNARVIPSVAYTDPEVAWVGLTETRPRPRALRSIRARSRGRHQAARLPTAETKALPSCCSMTAPMRTATGKFLATASSARTLAT